MSEEIHNARVNIEKDKARKRGFFGGSEERRDKGGFLISVLRWKRHPKHQTTDTVLHRAIVQTHKDTKLDGENLEEALIRNPMKLLMSARVHKINCDNKIVQMARLGYGLTHAHHWPQAPDNHTTDLFFKHALTRMTRRERVETEKYPTIHEGYLDERESLVKAGLAGVGKGIHYSIVGGIAGAFPEAIPFLSMIHGHYPYGYAYRNPVPPIDPVTRTTMGAAGAVGGLALGTTVGAWKNINKARDRNAQEKFKRGDRVRVGRRVGTLQRHDKTLGKSTVRFDDDQPHTFRPMVRSYKLRSIEEARKVPLTPEQLDAQDNTVRRDGSKRIRKPSRWERLTSRLNDKLDDPNDTVNVRKPKRIGWKGNRKKKEP